ncbi:MAG: exodeoxyribonuclease VII small subunit [Gammaproteobacteria bacterium]|nr:exodeoxyribonuclease VII small subunit [Gammaproteobacteria bacterium]
MANKKQTKSDFETALAELTEIVTAMEEGGLSLEDSIKRFERGVVLIHQCQKVLKDAEQKVQILKNIEQNALEDFTVEE